MLSPSPLKAKACKSLDVSAVSVSVAGCVGDWASVCALVAFVPVCACARNPVSQKRPFVVVASGRLQ